MPYRRFFKKVADENTTHQIHIIEIGHEFWVRLIQFRDYLVLFPDKAKQYEQVKVELSDQEWNDINDYANAKTEFIKSIEIQAHEYFTNNNS